MSQELDKFWLETSFMLKEVKKDYERLITEMMFIDIDKISGTQIKLAQLDLLIEFFDKIGNSKCAT